MTQELMRKLDASKHPGAKLHPKMEAVLLEAAHFNPALTYVATGAVSSANPSSPFITRVAVFDGNSPVGLIEITTRYSRVSGNITVYAIISDNIRNSRGKRNQKQTKHLKEAMRAIKEAFRPKEVDKIAEELVEVVKDKINSVVRWTKDHMRNAIVNNYEMIFQYLDAVHSGVHTSNTLPAQLVTALGSKWSEYSHNLQIASAVAKEFSNNYGAVARIERDGTITMVDLQTNTLVPCRSTYDLPTHYQEKITILKLMEQNQPIEHIGAKFVETRLVNSVRLDSEVFFLIDGPTYTTQ